MRMPCSLRNVFIKDEYGTLPSQLTNQCGRALALGRLSVWREGPAQQNPWWREVAQWLPLTERSYPMGALLLEMTVQRHNARGLRVEALAAQFPERKERRRRWFAAAEAARLVAEPELRAMLADLAEDPARLTTGGAVASG